MFSHREVKVQHLAPLSLHTIRRRFMVVEGLGLESHSQSGSRFVALPVQSLRVQGDSRLRGKRLGASPAQRMRLQGDSRLKSVCVCVRVCVSVDTMCICRETVMP